MALNGSYKKKRDEKRSVEEISMKVLRVEGVSLAGWRISCEETDNFLSLIF